MTSEKQPSSNDYRKRIARPLYVQTFSAADEHKADAKANDYSDLVTDQGGEVTRITPLVEAHYLDNETTIYHLRVVTYRAASRIDP
jgi:hypothetical protein